MQLPYILKIYTIKQWNAHHKEFKSKKGFFYTLFRGKKLITKPANLYSFREFIQLINNNLADYTDWGLGYPLVLLIDADDQTSIEAVSAAHLADEAKAEGVDFDEWANLQVRVLLRQYIL